VKIRHGRVANVFKFERDRQRFIHSVEQKHRPVTYACSTTCRAAMVVVVVVVAVSA